MPINRYENFDILIEPATGGYRARVLTSPVGQATALLTLPFDPQITANPLHWVGGAVRNLELVPADNEETQTPLDPKRFGGQLFSALFAGDLGVSLRRSLDLVRQQEAGLRIRLRLDDAPALATLPWEYLFDATTNRFLILSRETPIVRYLALPQGEEPLQTPLPLRLLVMMADAKDGGPRLNVAAEQARLATALADLVRRGNLEITWLEQATLRELQRTLRRDRYHLFHFIGHGWFDAATRSNGLLLENDQGGGEQVDTTRLGVLLHNHPTLRLAFLNACEGARLVEGQAFNGVAQHLVQQGLPAVIAMQFPVSDAAAITLAHEFYGALADHYPVDAALTEARVALFGQQSVMEWGAPVLFMRTPDGNLWQPAGEASMSKQEQTPRQIDTDGGAYIAGNVRTGGDFIGRDKVVHGDEVKGDKVLGDKVLGDKVQGHKAGGDVIVATVGAGAKNVAIGKHIQQTINELGAPTPDDRRTIEQHFERLATLLNNTALDPRTAGRAESNLETLQEELTKTAADETPSASTITRIGDWLLDNVPQLAQAVTELFGLPAVAKVLGKAGEVALQWWKKRFGSSV